MTIGPAAELTGTWRLVSYELTGSDGRVRHPYGPAPAGFLTLQPRRLYVGRVRPARPPRFRQR